MMKKLILTFMLLAIGFGANAQIDFGPRVTVTSTKLSLKDNVTAIEEGDRDFGYQFGAFLRVKVPIVGLYVQPEALFSKTGATFQDGTDDIDLSFNQIDVPVMLGAKVGPLRLQAGPSFRFLTKAETDINGTVQDVKENYKDTTVGYQAGVGIDLLKYLALDLKYEGSMSDISEDAGGSGFAVDQRVNQWVFAVGIKLF